MLDEPLSSEAEFPARNAEAASTCDDVSPRCAATASMGRARSVRSGGAVPARRARRGGRATGWRRAEAGDHLAVVRQRLRAVQPPGVLVQVRAGPELGRIAGVSRGLRAGDQLADPAMEDALVGYLNCPRRGAPARPRGGDRRPGWPRSRCRVVDTCFRPRRCCSPGWINACFPLARSPPTTPRCRWPMTPRRWSRTSSRCCPRRKPWRSSSAARRSSASGEPSSAASSQPFESRVRSALVGRAVWTTAAGPRSGSPLAVGDPLRPFQRRRRGDPSCQSGDSREAARGGERPDLRGLRHPARPGHRRRPPPAHRNHEPPRRRGRCEHPPG